MGKLFYDSGFSADFEDRALIHLQVVIGGKLRRGEPFYFSWHDGQTVGGGRTTLWLAPQIALRFKYFGSRWPAINPVWISVLTASSNSTHGLQLLPEPPPDSGS